MKRAAQGRPQPDAFRIPLEQFGRDHDSTLLYIETRCVDYRGKVNFDNLSCNSARHPYSNHERQWDDKYTTRLAEGFTAPAGHDDWDCIDDFVSEGLLEWRGTGANPIFVLTDAGWERVGKLRRARAERMLKERA